MEDNVWRKLLWGFGWFNIIVGLMSPYIIYGIFHAILGVWASYESVKGVNEE